MLDRGSKNHTNRKQKVQTITEMTTKLDFYKEKNRYSLTFRDSRKNGGHGKKPSPCCSQ